MNENEILKAIYGLLLAHQDGEDVHDQLLDVVTEAYGGRLSRKGVAKLGEILRRCERHRWEEIENEERRDVVHETKTLYLGEEGITVHVLRERTILYRDVEWGGHPTDFRDESFYLQIFLPDGRFNVFDHDEMIKDNYVLPVRDYDDIPF